jgi:uncharacterized protein YndB with AHSA1/START domain
MTTPEQVYETYIRTTPEKLWAAITNPEFTRQYWGGGSNVSDWKKGSKWSHMNDGDTGGVKCFTGGQVLESTPPTRLVLSWAKPEDPADDSRVTFEIEAIEDMVRLKVVHGAFKEGSALASKVAWGWPRVIASLKSFLETGKGLNVWAGR